MKYCFLTIILLLLIIFGCTEPEWSTTLYSQQIENSSKILYKFDAWGGRDTHVFGYTILDSTQKFSVNRVRKLPISYLLEIPRYDSILAVEIEKLKRIEERPKRIYKPTKQYSIQRNGIDIMILRYQYYGSANRKMFYGKYSFGNFKESRDSLYFFGLDKIYGLTLDSYDLLAVEKGNVIIRQNFDNSVVEIRVDNVQLSEDKEIVSIKSYFLSPSYDLKTIEFSDYGIYKEVN